jgi:hypothetical protein
LPRVAADAPPQRARSRRAIRGVVYKMGRKRRFPDLSPTIPEITSLSWNAGRGLGVCPAKNAATTMANRGLLRPVRCDRPDGIGHFRMSDRIAGVFLPTCLTQLCDHSADRGDFSP